jgi:dihydroflavonol-4-reductase
VRIVSTVAVTGASGFIGCQVILRLLADGHAVRATVRSLTREPDVRAMLAAGGATPGDRLSFHAADLGTDAGWREAIQGCDFVQHVASPFPAGAPKHEDDLIVPAREGTLRVLRAARDARVRRVVLTSSFAAVGYGAPPRSQPFDEDDWTCISADTAPYSKSKTLAERAAWDFVAGEGAGLELSVVNPVAVFGPVLGPDFSTSIQMILRLLNGGMPACPKLYFGVVDVRDVADLHVSAMTHARAAGERFLAVAGDFLSVRDIALVLKRRMGGAARRVRTWQIPDWAVRLAALRDPTVRLILPELGKRKNATHGKATTLLGWSPRPREECIVATAESLLRLGLVR